MRARFQMHVEDLGWIDCCHVEPINSSEDWRDYPEPEEKIVCDQFELMGFSYEASVQLQASFDATNAICSTVAEAFVNILRVIMEPIEDCFYKMFRDLDSLVIKEKHFDGVYNRPKMREYFKMQPNVCNLNNKIRKARNLL